MVESHEAAIILFLTGILATIPSLISPTLALQIVQVAASLTSALFFYYGTIAPRRLKPQFDVVTSVVMATPELNFPNHERISKPASGKILTMKVTNDIKSKVNAQHSRVKLMIGGVTKGEEYLPWRYVSVASGRGAGWQQYHDIELLRGDTALLVICWTEEQSQAGYLQTSSPEVQWNPYKLNLGVEYRCKLTIFGDFKPSVFQFSFVLQSNNDIQVSAPKKVKE